MMMTKALFQQCFFVSLLIMSGAASERVRAQDPYQLLRQSGDGFAQVEPGREFVFPEDHYPHERFKIEWWYLTANLTDSDGQDYGVHWTLFRQSMSAALNPGGWQSNQTWMAHTAISTPSGFEFSQRFARGGIGQAGVVTNERNTFEAWMDDWLWQSDSSTPFPGQLTASTDNQRLKLRLNASDNWVLQGKNGFSQKSDLGQASYYYSQPFIDITGTIWVGDDSVEVKGQGWLDREWSSQPLADNQDGWDWVSLHLSDGSALMVYQLRHDSGEHYISGSWVGDSGEVSVLEIGDVTMTPQSITRVSIPSTVASEARTSTKEIPLEWRVLVPKLGIDISVKTDRPNSWLATAFPYWEGPVVAEGSHRGMGYLELTGY
jgi:predicted secreted hydrolase